MRGADKYRPVIAERVGLSRTSGSPGWVGLSNFCDPEDRPLSGLFATTKRRGSASVRDSPSRLSRSDWDCTVPIHDRRRIDAIQCTSGDICSPNDFWAEKQTNFIDSAATIPYEYGAVG